MKGFEFNNERIKESAQKLAIKMRHDDPGAKGGLYIINEDGADREISAEDLFTEPMTEEVKQLRCTVADLIGENERLKEDRKKLAGMFVKSLALNASLMDDLMPEWRHFAKEELDDLEEALK